MRIVAGTTVVILGQFVARGIQQPERAIFERSTRATAIAQDVEDIDLASLQAGFDPVKIVSVVDTRCR